MRLAWLAVAGCTAPVSPRNLASLRDSAKLSARADPPAFAFDLVASAPLERDVAATIDGVPLALTYADDAPQLYGLTYEATERSQMVLTISDPTDVWTIVMTGFGPDDLEIAPVSPGQPTTITWRDGPGICSGDFELTDALGHQFHVQNSWLRIYDTTVGLDIPSEVAPGGATAAIQLQGELQLGAVSARGGIGPCDGPSECILDLGLMRHLDVTVEMPP